MGDLIECLGVLRFGSFRRVDRRAPFSVKMSLWIDGTQTSLYYKHKTEYLSLFLKMVRSIGGYDQGQSQVTFSDMNNHFFSRFPAYLTGSNK